VQKHGLTTLSKEPKSRQQRNMPLLTELEIVFMLSLQRGRA
jgi:hypothetical protein